MQKHKAGLHKQVSSIFTGVPIPKDTDGGEQASTSATKEPADYGPPSHLSGRKVEAPQLKKSSPKALTPEKPKADKKDAGKMQMPVEIKHEGPSALEQLVQRIKDKLFAPKPGVSPARQKAMVVLVPVMFIGMVLAFYKVLGGGPDETTGSKTFKPSNVAAAATSTIDWQIPAAYPTTLRDPMQFKPEEKPTPTPDDTGNIDIKGILYSEENPSVIIGIEILHEGDKVSGATIVKINKDSVEFEMNGKRWTQKVQ
ncbi:MAG: hypothetical protein ACYTDW_03355 [Planctomycetota bacterium]|jgi:hypothetical protein